MKKKIINILVMVLSLVISSIVAELIFRQMIFSKGNSFKELKNAGYYTSQEYEEDFWKLRIIWNWENNISSPFRQHSFLGWTDNFDPVSYKHNKSNNVQGKRPVLLFGDSFAHCVNRTECFDDYLNADTAFNKNYYMLNYGVIGYGLDQIYYLMDKTTDLYDKPFVVFSFFTGDMQRSILKLRDGLKPYYSIENDSLVYHNENLAMHISDYINQNPPKINSYLLRKIIFDERLNSKFSLVRRLKDNIEGKYIDQAQIINAEILENSIKMFRRKKIDFLIVVFCGSTEYSSAERWWPEKLSKKVFETQKAPYILVRDSMAKYATNSPNDDLRFFIYGDGHPTSYLNSIVSGEIKQFILNEADSAKQIK